MFAGIAMAAMGMTLLVLSMSYSPLPQATPIPLEENGEAAASNNDNNYLQSSLKNFPTLGRDKVANLTKDAVTNEEYGIRVEFVKSYNGYLTGRVAPVNTRGEGPQVEPNALLLSSNKADVYHHEILICGPDGICIDDSQGGGPIFAATSGISNNDHQTTFYQFYPLNEVSWNIGDAVDIWVLVSHAAKDGIPVGELQWISLGEVTIKECNSQEWCPNK